ncbi:NAD-dependent epimerase/dehydratase family protein [Mycetohabitans endofungorum]|uniref:NAD-dependent epimerase/dehydratase family protein n=1 Tax=Mycetohabitans endofungorum TaxID=417203 RepID=UPI0030D0D455
MRQTSVVVLGASGFIGRYVVNALVHAGKRVVVATRRHQHAAHLTQLPVDVVEADVYPERGAAVSDRCDVRGVLQRKAYDWEKVNG